MGRRKLKQQEGVYKKELRNEPLKFEVSQREQVLLKRQIVTKQMKQSEYLRYLLLEEDRKVPIKTTAKNNSYSLTETIISLGRRLNQLAKKLNQSILADETIAINNHESRIFQDIVVSLELATSRIGQISDEGRQKRNIQIKFLVTPTELAQIKIKLKSRDVTLSKYLREHITNYSESKHENKAKKFREQIGRLKNNIDQIIEVIIQEKKSNRLVIIAPEVEYQLKHIQYSIENIQQQIKFN